ncbi:MAG: hypothetical protein AAB446_02320 [Patescibacteria group bacterium]
MDSKQITEIANEKIKEWAKDMSKLVIGLDGYTGVGKTTLLNNLIALNPEIVAVNRDDFLFTRAEVKEKLAKAEDKSVVFELEITNDQKLIDLVDAFRNNNDGTYEIDAFGPTSGETDIKKTFDLSKKIMIVEGVFMFHPKLPMSKLWNKRIYLEGDIAKIDERRIKREKEKWGDKYFPETHPDSNFRNLIIGLKRYFKLYKPKEKADLVLTVDQSVSKKIISN